jgi:hypothetical protein
MTVSKKQHSGTLSSFSMLNWTDRLNQEIKSILVFVFLHEMS